MSDKIFQAFLQRQYDEGMVLAAASDVLKLIPMPGGNPPCRYIAHFEGRKGLVRDERGEIVEFDQFGVSIWFPDDYLRHVIEPQVLSYLGPHRRPWHPNIHAEAPFICVHLEPGTNLVDLIYAVYEVWTWNLLNTGDEGLNHAAAQWARNQKQFRLPIDRRPLKRRAVQINVTPASAKEGA